MKKNYVKSPFVFLFRGGNYVLLARFLNGIAHFLNSCEAKTQVPYCVIFKNNRIPKINFYRNSVLVALLTGNADPNSRGVVLNSSLLLKSATRCGGRFGSVRDLVWSLFLDKLFYKII